MAENICENLHKGSLVLVSGEMRQESWEKDGQKKYAWRVLVSDVGESLKWANDKPKTSSSSSYDEDPPFL
jgi:single-strand DNA-binding protein